ncbi:MAG: response regulator, partial [Candidatus Omnitrophica bacterium]|nr:response regulator [Candidatus Omnitrophota bacterium]
MITKSDILDARILIVDDQELDIRLIEEYLRKAGFRNITKTIDSSQVLELFQKIKPDLLIVDIYMPKVDGFKIIQEIRAQNPSDYLPILVLSNEETQEIRFRALEEGAKDYLVKPYNRIEAIKRINNLLETRLLHNQMRDQNYDLEEKVKQRTKELYETQVDVIQRLARAIEYRDSETGMHTLRMSHYAKCLAEKIGLSTSECEMLLIASPLHDIGKIGIPDSILKKPGALTSEEWTIMKT